LSKYYFWAIYALITNIIFLVYRLDINIYGREVRPTTKALAFWSKMKFAPKVAKYGTRFALKPQNG